MGRGRFWRQLQVFTTALSVFLDYKILQKKEKWSKPEEVDRVWEQTHEKNAAKILKTIVRLEGLWVKLGQYLSTRADVLPEAYIKCLRQLQDSLPPRPLSEVHRTIRTELGTSPDELFASFDDVPLATASIAQVHKAEMKDGRNVVVKVQHEGIKAVILQDLKNALTIVKWLAWAEPQYDFGPVMDEWCNEVPKELDFNKEAENTTKVAQNLASESRGNFDKVDVRIPGVIQHTEKVLVLEFMDGVRLSDVKALESLGVNKQTLVETITRSYAHQIFIDGFFNADPHPGNFLVSKEAPFRPILLDFGLTKSLTFSKKQALAKLLLACAEGDYASLLSAFTELGLKLRLDIPEEAMEVTNFFFRRSVPAKESRVVMQQLSKEGESRRKRIEQKLQQEREADEKDSHVRNPVDAFPGDAVFFMRVLNLLRGMSSMLDTEVVYLEIMRPFAEATLFSDKIVADRNFQQQHWILNKKVNSAVEEKLRNLLQQMAGQNRLLGIQVCAYKDGKVIIDTAGGVMGKYDPRPVETDSLFSVFSVTKGVTAGLLHWLADQGKISYEEKVSTYWKEFGRNGKEEITVAQVLNHTAGLQSALSAVIQQNPMIMCNWEEVVNRLAQERPVSEPGEDQQYHTLTYGWLCGAIAEKATGRSFQELLEDAFVSPLRVDGEFYVGIPPGVESRLASLTMDVDDLRASMARLRPPGSSDATTEAVNGELEERMRKATGLLQGDILKAFATLPYLFNTLFVRRAVIPSANGHFSARALARFYAALATGGHVPDLPASEPQLGSHPHKPNKVRKVSQKKQKKVKAPAVSMEQSSKIASSTQEVVLPVSTKLYSNPEVLDAFVGRGKFSDLALEDGRFGLGFIRMGPRGQEHSSSIPDGKLAFGHSGLGGSAAFCDPTNNFSLAVTLNKWSVGDVTAEIIRLITSELDIPCPAQFAPAGHVGVEMTLVDMPVRTDSLEGGKDLGGITEI
ncbi:hypothetical protein R1sor_027538 [Riccia sorocarpa]|uniref:Uncharacterized protein n=1 Tax=Riccia sorocarpa TaxID=122646 RepID=A0ABD3GHT1_9MARC